MKLETLSLEAADMAAERLGRPRLDRSVLQIFSACEWPTLALTAVIYSGWLATTYWHALLPWPLRIVCGGWLIAWQSSLQHEAIHGHPTPWRRVNTALVAWPLALWLPYERYRDSHLVHHATEALTIPGEDPETHYRAPPTGLLLWLDHVLSTTTSTLLGRLAFGPVLLVARFLAAELPEIGRTPGRTRLWAIHGGLAGAVLLWLTLVCRMGLGEYVLTFVYPGAALTLLRSFAEHRAHAEKGRRVAVVERAPVLGLLFLHNNLHALHHARPGLAWYRLPRAYRQARAGLLEENGGLVYAGYLEVVVRFLLRAQDRVTHPDLIERRAA